MSNRPPAPDGVTMERDEITNLITQLRERQADVSGDVMSSIRHEDLEGITDDGFTVKDTLQMWVHELRSHHRDLILARGRLTNDNPHFHVPHFVRQANEEFGKFIGELSALSDEDLNRQVPPDGRTVREVAEHVLATLEDYIVQQARSGTGEQKPSC
ncbi:MAG: hypothetical protein HN712_04675 [Gemmatimonadetes bacterium]|jgi:hypothetical protein|nr:hypothetical protein [Gemmatimonadota bacterium]MBT6144242.1 hypothetical protein [Gemmatimonadota bacterium]MBT7859580.1 hypothetical protein [Gemmatimonadota bacterium]